MSHHIHHTEGFVLSSTGVGEANKYITIFTRELGVIGAVAQGIRKIDSKLRYALQDYSYVRVDVIRGKHSWRITSAQAQSAFDELKSDAAKFSLFAKLLTIVRRLCSGEDPNESLYEHMYDSFIFLSRENLSSEEREGFELVFLIRMLHNLGHMQPFPLLSQYLDSTLDAAVCLEAFGQKSVLVREINTALKESQL